MSQISFSDAEYAGKRKKTRREVFLEEMEQGGAVEGAALVIEPHCTGSRPAGVGLPAGSDAAPCTPGAELVCAERSWRWKHCTRSRRCNRAEGLNPEQSRSRTRRRSELLHMLEESDLAEDIFKQVNALLAHARSAAQARQHRRCDDHRNRRPRRRTEQGERDPEDASDQEGQPVMALRDEGTHRRGRRRWLVHTVATTAAGKADVEQVADHRTARRNRFEPTRATAAHKGNVVYAK